MKQAMNIATTSAKFTVGIGLSTVFVCTMDDLIYSTFRKNIIMPVSMVCVRAPAGTISSEEVKEVVSGTK